MWTSCSQSFALILLPQARVSRRQNYPRPFAEHAASPSKFTEFCLQIDVEFDPAEPLRLQNQFRPSGLIMADIDRDALFAKLTQPRF